MMESPQTFVEEIDFNELYFLEVVGKGAFGVVSRAQWRNTDVAVKLIETDSERKAFITELKQLSRVSHPNIVKLYGACTKQPVCLVMEYAEGGSLYNVLHGTGPQPDYTMAHAMSWAQQCAIGVEYLHGMKPKPLVHRDLKPPNLLLIAGGTVLKICDFGTACDAHTHMTNNKGSAAWMAPEVFEGVNYSEKCDVFSFGIILWEVLTRRKPFDEIGGPAFRIMWAVHNGTRPPLIQDCPKPIQNLMTRCWASNPVERPSMSEVARIITYLFQFFSGADEPLVYPRTPDPEYTPTSTGSTYEGNPLMQATGGATMRDTVREARFQPGEPVPLVPPTPPKTKPVVIEDRNRRTSAPASLAASRESLDSKGSRCSTPSADVLNKRYSADLSKLEEMDMLSQKDNTRGDTKPMVRGHRRTGSYGTSPLVGDSNASTPAVGSPTRESTAIHHSITAPGQLNLMTQGGGSPAGLTSVQGGGGLAGLTSDWEPGMPVNITLPGTFPGTMNSNQAAYNMAFIAMDHQLQPLAPSPGCSDSMAIFEQHAELAQEYMRVQTEVALLTQRQHELMMELHQDAEEYQHSTRFVTEYSQLASENESLQMLHKNLKKQIEIIRQNQQQGQVSDGV